MKQLMRAYPYEAIENTRRIADMCDLNLEFGRVQLPEFPLPDGHTPSSYLQQLSEEGLRRHVGDNPPRQLAFYGAHEALEGPKADGIVILEFDDMDHARAWHGSHAYQEAMKHRQLGADYRVLLVEGVKPA